MPWRESSVSEQRKAFIGKYLHGGERNLSELCREFGISRKCGYKWIERFETGGIAGLEDQSRRPKHFRDAVSGDVVCEIVKIRDWKETWGGRKIRSYLLSQGIKQIPCARTIDRILKRCGFVTSTPASSKRKQGKYNVIQPEACNDVWTLDMKGWWTTLNARRCDPLTIRDEHTRYILCLAALERGVFETVKEQFQETFIRYGLPLYIRSDNGSPFASAKGYMGLTRLAVWFLKQDICPNRIAPASPYMNGAHERMHRDIKAELQKTPAQDARAEQKRFDIWRAEYNRIRPHQSLNDQPPAKLYRSSKRKYKLVEEDFDYPQNFVLRKVSANGEFNWRNTPIRFAKSLAGEKIALEFLSDQTLRIWFRNYPLGITDVHCRKIQPAEQFEYVSFEPKEEYV